MEDISIRISNYLLDWKSKNSKEFYDLTNQKNLYELSPKEKLRIFIYASTIDIKELNEYENNKK